MPHRFRALRGDLKPASLRNGVLIGWCGMRGLVTQATAFALIAKKLSLSRAIGYLLIAGAVFLAVAMQNGLNIGVRHILPIYALAAVLAGAGLAALATLFP